MSRRTSIFEDVMRLPWPVGVVLALLVLIAQQILLAIEPQGILGQVFKTPVKIGGYFLIALFSFASFFSFLRQVIRAKRFGNTRSLADIRGLSWRQKETHMPKTHNHSNPLETWTIAHAGADLLRTCFNISGTP